jgi:nucleotide sugar dehydrogenase
MIFGLSKEQVEEKLNRGEVSIAVYGLGRVGLPLAVAWLRAGQRVIGVDINPSIVDKINSGISPITDEPLVPESVKKFVSEGKFHATTDLIKASQVSEVKFIAVPTALTEEKRFDGRALESALRGIGRGLKQGDAISIECSVPPTTTENLAKPILEKESGLKAEEDFALAASPERIYEGRVLEDLEERYAKVIGGIAPRSTELFATLYSRIARKGIHRMSSSRAAELSKLFEGVYRDVNIALANELAGLCQALNVDFAEARAAANSQPFCHLHKPGVGVGGLCIPVYPYFIVEKAEEKGVPVNLTRMARAINEEMPKNTVDLLQKALEDVGLRLKDVKVAILGLAFRGNVADSRLSPTYELARQLKLQAGEVVVQDPYIEADKTLKAMSIPLLRSIEDAVKGASAILIATDHDDYTKMDLAKLLKLARSPTILLDGRGIIDLRQVPFGTYFTGIGRPTIH